MSRGACRGQGVGCRGAGVKGDCGMPDTGAKNGIHVLCRDGALCSLLNHFSSLRLLYFQDKITACVDRN